MNAYEQKLADRKARLEARADRLDAVAAAKFRAADMREEASGIPFGQPILVGHHSEGRHRRAIARAHAAMDKGVELSKAADAARDRAAGVGHGGISADDPDAIAKLAAKLAALEARADAEVKWNAQIRKGGAEAMIDAPDAIKAEVARMVASWPYMARGFFHVANRRAEIRRIKDRIAQLERNAARPVAAPVERDDGVRVVENAEDNRLQLFFPGKPDAEMRAALKGRGFRWAPSVGAWQRQLNNAARHAAHCVLADG